MPQILPLLNENGLVLTQEPSFVTYDGNVQPTLVTRLVHVATDEVQRSEMLLMLDKNTAQGLGSAITYARRYSILSILGLVADVDDDGNQASAAAPKPVAKKAAPARTTKAKPAAKPAEGDDEDW
jgi:ERF superfamily